MNEPARRAAPVGRPTKEHWLLLALLILFGGSSFSGIRVAVETASPAIVASARLWIGVFVLWIYMRATGRTLFPLLTEDKKIAPAWKSAAAIGLAGYAIPMSLFPFAQQTVSSMLAGIYMAFMPIATIFLAALFASEPLTRSKLIGFAAGTIGVIVLIGPAALKGILSADVIAQLALICAATGYAVASVVLRRAPEVPARSFAVAFMLTGAVFSTPFALIDLAGAGEVSARSWLAIVYLGVLPTGITAIFIIHIVRGAGAGFLAMGNYLTPAIAIGFGIALFGETLFLRYALGLATILIGLGIAQPQTLAWFGRLLPKRPKGRFVP